LKNVIFYSVQKPYTGFYKYRGPKSDRASVRGHIIFSTVIVKELRLCYVYLC